MSRLTVAKVIRPRSLTVAGAAQALREMRAPVSRLTQAEEFSPGTCKRSAIKPCKYQLLTWLSHILHGQTQAG